MIYFILHNIGVRWMSGDMTYNCPWCVGNAQRIFAAGGRNSSSSSSSSNSNHSSNVPIECQIVENEENGELWEALKSVIKTFDGIW